MADIAPAAVLGDRERVRARMNFHRDVLMAIERERGYQVIELDSVWWYSSQDWDSDAILSRKGNHVRIVLISALRPGKGHFKGMMVRMVRDGLTFEVVSPMPDLQDTLKRNGWKRKRLGSGELAHDVWRPTYKMFGLLRTMKLPGEESKNTPETDESQSLKHDGS